MGAATGLGAEEISPGSGGRRATTRLGAQATESEGRGAATGFGAQEISPQSRGWWAATGQTTTDLKEELHESVVRAKAKGAWSVGANGVRDG